MYANGNAVHLSSWEKNVGPGELQTSTKEDIM